MVMLNKQYMYRVYQEKASRQHLIFMNIRCYRSQFTVGLDNYADKIR